MTNHLKISVLSALLLAVGLTLASDPAQALPINRCARLMSDQAGRETIANACNTCIIVKVERRRPGQTLGTPTIRDFTIPQGSNQPLPFRGPGRTRVMSEAPCQAPVN